MKSVAVMMSTYNGERFLEEQIESVLHQADLKVDLFIRDDGSSDGTIELLKKYEPRSEVHIEYGDHKGIGNSYMSLIYSVPDTYDYYAFSDQDDVWHEDKLITAVRSLERENGMLYASNLECMGMDGRGLGMKFEPEEIPHNEKLLSVVCRNRLYGCTQVFTNELCRIVKERRPSEQLLRVRIHDNWLAVSAAAVGKIIYDEGSHICYRRHDRNTTMFRPSRGEIWKRRISNLQHSDILRRKSMMACEMIRCYPENMENLEEKEKEMISSLADIRPLRNKAMLIRNRDKIIRTTKEPSALFILRVMTGML